MADWLVGRDRSGGTVARAKARARRSICSGAMGGLNDREKRISKTAGCAGDPATWKKK